MSHSDDSPKYYHSWKRRRGSHPHKEGRAIRTGNSLRSCRPENLYFILKIKALELLGALALTVRYRPDAGKPSIAFGSEFAGHKRIAQTHQ